MNQRIAKRIREGVAWARINNLVLLSGGAWFEWDGEHVVGADPLGAVLLMSGLVVKRPEDLARPGFCDLVRGELGVDNFWLRRFWLGFDRGFQVVITDVEGEEIKDDVSAFGIQLWREVTRG